MFVSISFNISELNIRFWFYRKAMNIFHTHTHRMNQWNYDNATQSHVADAPATNNKNTYLFLSVDKISIEGYFCINHGNNNKTHRTRTHKTNKQTGIFSLSSSIFLCVSFLFCYVSHRPFARLFDCKYFTCKIFLPKFSASYRRQLFGVFLSACISGCK